MLAAVSCTRRVCTLRHRSASTRHLTAPYSCTCTARPLPVVPRAPRDAVEGRWSKHSCFVSAAGESVHHVRQRDSHRSDMKSRASTASDMEGSIRQATHGLLQGGGLRKDLGVA